jgi:hypothetical protein
MNVIRTAISSEMLIGSLTDSKTGKEVPVIIVFQNSEVRVHNVKNPEDVFRAKVTGPGMVFGGTKPGSEVTHLPAKDYSEGCPAHFSFPVYSPLLGKDVQIVVECSDDYIAVGCDHTPDSAEVYVADGVLCTRIYSDMLRPEKSFNVSNN